MTFAIIIELLMGIALLAIGWWGRSQAGHLAPAWADDEERRAREAVYGRGSVACLAAGVVVTAVALITAVSVLA